MPGGVHTRRELEQGSGSGVCRLGRAEALQAADVDPQGLDRGCWRQTRSGRRNGSRLRHGARALMPMSAHVSGEDRAREHPRLAGRTALPCCCSPRWSPASVHDRSQQRADHGYRPPAPSVLAASPLGIVRIIPFRIHSAAEPLGALLLLLAPILFGVYDADSGLAIIMTTRQRRPPGRARPSPARADGGHRAIRTARRATPCLVEKWAPM